MDATATGTRDDDPSTLLTHEHREVDDALEQFVAELDHGAGDPQPVLDAVRSLRRHIYIEETFMFPPLAKAGLVMPVAVMLREHGLLWRTLDGLTQTLAELDSVETRERARALCLDLLAQLDRHNLKEEKVVYSGSEALLSEGEHAALVASFDLERQPDSWVCQEAAS